jgi:hypothetical protein
VTSEPEVLEAKTPERASIREATMPVRVGRRGAYAAALAIAGGIVLATEQPGTAR